MKVKILWDSAQSMGFMLHLLNSHKKYQLKYCDFGRNIGNLRGDSSSVSFLHLQQSAVPALCLSDKEGLPGQCHSFSIGAWGGAHFPHLCCAHCFLFELAQTEGIRIMRPCKHNAGAFGGLVSDALSALECLGCEGRRGG